MQHIRSADLQNAAEYDSTSIELKPTREIVRDADSEV